MEIKINSKRRDVVCLTSYQGKKRAGCSCRCVPAAGCHVAGRVSGTPAVRAGSDQQRRKTRFPADNLSSEVRRYSHQPGESAALCLICSISRRSWYKPVYFLHLNIHTCCSEIPGLFSTLKTLRDRLVRGEECGLAK